MAIPATTIVQVTQVPILVLDFLKVHYRRGTDIGPADSPSSASVLRWAASDHARSLGYAPEAVAAPESVPGGKPEGRQA